jgi:tetratricopeptide (TPR) repeat protein
LAKLLPAKEEPAPPPPQAKAPPPSPPPATETAAPPTSPPAGDRTKTQQTAKAVFAAKTRPARKPALWLGAGLAVALAAILAGAWWWLETMSKPSLAPAAARPPSAVPPAPPKPVAEAKAETPQPPAAAPTESPAPAKAAAIQEPPPPAKERPADSPIRIQRESRQASVNPVLVQAYEAYNRGDLATASTLYRQVAAADPDSRDARLGLAAIAMQNNKPEEAAAIYARLLQRDPRDAAAHAGLAALSGAEDAQAQETRLKLLLSRDPQADALHFALGSVYAKQSRWAEAQQSYFNAFAAAPANPDYAYNLAVSLDMLGQYRLAAEHYEKALALAPSHPHRFAPEAASTRLTALRRPPTN